MLVASSNINTSRVARLFKETDLNDTIRNSKKQQEQFKSVDLKKIKLIYNKPQLAKHVLQMVCDELHVQMEYVVSKSRQRPFVEARQMYSMLMLRFNSIDMTLKLIGEVMNRDHATVIHCERQCRDLYATNIPYRQRFDSCVQRFTQFFCNSEHYAFDYESVPQF